MKKLLLVALMGVLLLPALPGAAQSPSPTPSADPTPWVRPSPLVDPAPSTSPTPSASPTDGADAPAFQQTTSPALTYAGRGLTSGLSLTIAGQGLQTGVTATRVANATTEDCEGRACATAAGAAPPLGENAIAVSPGNPGPNQVQRFDLGEDASPELEQALTLTIGSAVAQTSDLPFATGTADGLSLDLTLTQTILGELPAEATDGLETALGEIAGALGPIADADPTGSVGGLTDLLEGLVGDLSSSPLLRIQAGQSTSSADFEETTVSATATAAGAVIVILPTPASTPLLPEGLAVIEVGPSTAAATADGTNRATAEARASIARITLLPGLLDEVPGLDPDSVDELPLDDILDLLPEEITDLLPIDDLLGGLGGGGEDEPEGEDPAGEDPEGEGEDPEGEDDGTGTPLDDILGGFMQADEGSDGFVIDLETGTEQTCILEATPLETCVTLGGTSETFTENGLGVGVLAAGVDLSLLRGIGEAAGEGGLPPIPGLDALPGGFAQVPTGPGLIEANIGRSEAGVAAAFVQATPTTPATTPPRPALPQTGGDSTVAVASLALMTLSGLAFVTLRRRRDV